jgi:hypothetical protein
VSASRESGAQAGMGPGAQWPPPRRRRKHAAVAAHRECSLVTSARFTRDRNHASRSGRENPRNRRAGRMPLRHGERDRCRAIAPPRIRRMIAAAIRAELRNRFQDVGKLIRAHPFETQRERVACSVVADVRRVFTTFRPIQRNAERVQHSRRRAVRGNFHAERFADLCGPRAPNADRDLVQWACVRESHQ